ncbi:MAG: ferritin-like domain-containing protein [Pseudonocardiales bacterium]|nr:ferritin-like domain-containing protein [Pseudonocardiales bacterium]
MGDKPTDDAVFGGRPVVAFGRDVDRRNFLRWAGLVGVGAAFVVGAGAAPAFASTLAPGQSPTPSPSPGGGASSTGDLGILNYALTLEYLEAEFYTQGLAANVVSGREMELITPIKAHEQAHVAAIMATVTKLGGTPVAKPTIKFPDGTFGGRDKFLQTASTFEELGVSAYHGQVPLIMSADVLGAAASIAGVESRHAAILAQLTGGKPFPDPFEQPKTMSDVLAAAKPFIS